MGIANASGVGRLTRHGKELVALSMRDKGIAFVGAAALLGSRGHRYVFLHLLCQGVEILCKAFLLLCDYDKHQPSLRKPIGHDLEKLLGALITEFGLRAPTKAFSDELTQLNALYKHHRLRYGSGYDILVDPASIPCGRVRRKVRAAVRLSHRFLPVETLETAASLGMRARR
jgi:hypothetical protein